MVDRQEIRQGQDYVQEKTAVALVSGIGRRFNCFRAQSTPDPCQQHPRQRAGSLPTPYRWARLLTRLQPPVPTRFLKPPGIFLNDHYTVRRSSRRRLHPAYLIPAPTV